MLSVGKVGPGNAGYYQSAVVAGVEDYYAGDVMLPVVGSVVRTWWVLSLAVWRLPLTPSCCWRQSAHRTGADWGGRR